MCEEAVWIVTETLREITIAFALAGLSKPGCKMKLAFEFGSMLEIELSSESQSTTGI
jgi:hypothetical protein